MAEDDPERQHHAVGEQFAFRQKLLGQAVEDQVEIQFAGDGDVETGHGSFRIKTCADADLRLDPQTSCDRSHQGDIDSSLFQNAQVGFWARHGR